MKRYDVYSQFVENDLFNELVNLLNKQKEIVVLCIGEDKVVSDSLGPMVGSMLKNKNIKTFVYGDLNHTINSKNLIYAINYINKNHNNAKILIVDSAVGSELNYIGIKEGAINCYSLPDLFVGDFAILGFNVLNGNGKYKMNCIGLNQIQNQASIISNAVTKSFNYLHFFV